MGNPILPALVYGKVTCTDTITKNSRIIGSRLVRVTNNRTNESKTVTTTSRGEYVFDAANFLNGYQLGDQVTVQMHNDFAEYYGNIKVSGDKIEFK